LFKYTIFLNCPVFGEAYSLGIGIEKQKLLNILTTGSLVMFKIKDMEIKHLRELRNFTQSYVSQQTYSLIEKKPEKSNLSRIQKIASVLDVKVSFLLNEEDAFNLYNFNQNGGNTASYINKVAHREFSEEYVKQLKEEIKYLRKIVDSRIMIQQKRSENDND
jgi:transcriptional regulator with XRE-family HTH domain